MVAAARWLTTDRSIQMEQVIAVGLEISDTYDAQLITVDGTHLALIQQDPAYEWAAYIVDAVNHYAELVPPPN